MLIEDENKKTANSAVFLFVKFVALVGKSWNRFCVEVSDFTTLLREAKEVYGGSLGAVPRSSAN